jgi:chromosome segregation ATPase
MGSFMQQIKDEKDRYEKLNMVQQEKITRLTKVSQSLTDNFNALSRQHSSNHATSQYQSDLCFALEQIADVFKASTDNDSLKQVVRKTQSTLQQKQLQLAELQGNLLNYEEKLTIVKDQFEQAREAFNQINEKHARILDEQEKNLTFLQGIVNWLSPWITSLRSPKSSGS